MRDKWREWARAYRWEPDGDELRVRLGSRQQRVLLAAESGAMLLRSRVARRAVLNRVSEPDLRAWQRNRVSELVGFRIDRQGVMVAETPVPADVTRDEWAFLVMNVARAADRFEYLLSGQDEE